MPERYLDEPIGRAMNAGKCLGLPEAARLSWGIISVPSGVTGEPAREDAVSGWWLGKGGSWMSGMRTPREEGGTSKQQQLSQKKRGKRGFYQEVMTLSA